MHYAGIGNCIELPKAQSTITLPGQNFIIQKFISLKIVVYILLAIKGVFAKDLGPMPPCE